MAAPPGIASAGRGSMAIEGPMTMPSREIQLKRRPVGAPVAEDFATIEQALPPPGPDEVQVRNLWMAVDPAMRGRMNDAKSYVPPFALDAAMEGPAIGEVIASNDPSFAVSYTHLTLPTKRIV